MEGCCTSISVRIVAYTRFVSTRKPVELVHVEPPDPFWAGDDPGTEGSAWHRNEYGSTLILINVQGRTPDLIKTNKQIEGYTYVLFLYI